MDEREKREQELRRRHRGRKTRPVRLLSNGQVFQSASALADYLGVSPSTAANYIKDGRAEYAGEAQ